VRQRLTGTVEQDGSRGSYGFLDEASGDMIVVTLFDADDRARHGNGLPRATLWNTTGRVSVTARSWEELGRGVW